ncbi:hypothetical protein F4604DRAFT_1927379 [Suillus subluteus]|nr:hypothetical protein F4604DRAFT_1927379 [Suillus subluteus]
MKHLRAHPADCRVLFYSDNKSHADGDHPSAKDKVSICQIIAKSVFEHDPDYENYYPNDPERFCGSTNSHISGLRKRYCECHDKLHLTGAGITPLDEMTAVNLHMQILEEFPWYDDLADILGGNPAVSLKTISSVPGVDHASEYFSLVQASTASSAQSSLSTRYGGYVPSAQPPPASAQYGGYTPSTQPPPPSAQFWGWAPPPSTQPAPPAAAYSESNLPSGTDYGGYVNHPGPNAQSHYVHSTHPSAPTPNQMHAPLPYSHPSQGQLHLPLNHEDEGMDYDDDDDYPSKVPIRPQTPTPSILSIASSHPHPHPPPPPPPTKFRLPEKPQTMLRDSCAAFGTTDPMRRISRGSLKPPSGLGSLHSWSTPTLTRSVRMSTTPMSQSAGSKNVKGRLLKKARSDILSQVGAITNKIRSIQSEKLDKVSREELKNDCYMAKLNLTR